jgi:hypothetical protein
VLPDSSHLPTHPALQFLFAEASHILEKFIRFLRYYIAHHYQSDLDVPFK